MIHSSSPHAKSFRESGWSHVTRLSAGAFAKEDHPPLFIFLNQVIYVSAVRFSKCRALDEKNVFSVEFGAPREIVGTGDYGVIDHQNFVVHEIVSAGWRIGR